MIEEYAEKKIHSASSCGSKESWERTNPTGIFSLMRKSGAQRGAHPTAPTPSTLSAGNRSGVQVIFTQEN